MELNIIKEKINNSGVYIIENSINNKMYIGSAIRFVNRYRDHKSCFVLNKHNRRFQNFVNKYGIDKLKFSILEEIDEPIKLIEREQYYIDKYNSSKSIKGFNICPTAGSLLGIKMPKSHIEKSSKRMIGNQIVKGRIATEEQKQQLVKANKIYWENNPEKLKYKGINLSNKLKGVEIPRTYLVYQNNILIDEMKTNAKIVAEKYNTNTTTLSQIVNGSKDNINGYSFKYKIIPSKRTNNIKNLLRT